MAAATPTWISGEHWLAPAVAVLDHPSPASTNMGASMGAGHVAQEHELNVGCLHSRTQEKVRRFVSR